ncbi:MAG TPA: sugar phosphate isomerase/epimerase [Chthoniobacterales bacterium]|nr:sugar phosphate isomerase/epimerase [Chthoniobacterales bacterium]
MKIATAPVNWNNADAPDFREWFPYSQILDLMVAAGYAATEWGMNMPSQVSQMLSDLNARRLQLLGGFVALELRNEAKLASEIERALEVGRFFKSLGAQLLIAADSGDPFRLAQSGRVDSTSGLKKHEWRNLTSGLDLIGNRLRAEGVKVVFHNHVGTYVETEAETARLLEETNPDYVGWCFDCGHIAYGGADVFRLLTKYGSRVRHAHLKDINAEVLNEARASRWNLADALKAFIFAPLGKGNLDLRRVLELLRDQGYNDWLVVEQDTTPLDPTAVARLNRISLEALLDELGIEHGRENRGDHRNNTRFPLSHRQESKD